MTAPANTQAQSATAIPADDPDRKLAVAYPDDPNMRFIAVAGGVYTILLTGEETGGRYCLIEMQVPPNAGPPPHRHDFEEMFTILEGEIDLTFRGTTQKAAAGATVNIPANAPHAFKNNSSRPARLLCMCSPPGQELFFMAVGVPVASRTAVAPKLSPEEQAETLKKIKALAPKYRTELLVH
jgi:quercetin dioxygenase-like cupin family protein